MATISIETVPGPSAADWYGWPWAYVGPTPPAPDPTINLLSVTPDGPLALVLEFDRPPAGDVDETTAYALSTGGPGYVPGIVSVAEEPDPDPDHVYSHFVRLVLASQATDGETYTVTVAGILGPCGEALGSAAASFEAAAVAPQVVSAMVDGATIGVAFDRPLDAETIGDPGDWTLSGDLALPTITGVALAAGGMGVVLAIAGDVLDGTTVEAPATVADVAGNAVDPAHRSAEIAAGLAAPVMAATDGESPYLAVTLNGEPLDNPWSPLPDDPSDRVEVLARAMLACLFTDRRCSELALLANPDDPYRGGTWSDPFCPERRTSRLWMLIGAPQTEDTRLRGIQYATEDLAFFRDGGWIRSLSVDAAFEGRGLGITVSYDDSVLTLGVA